jgi:hypothetical protein
MLLRVVLRRVVASQRRAFSSAQSKYTPSQAVDRAKRALIAVHPSIRFVVSEQMRRSTLFWSGTSLNAGMLSGRSLKSTRKSSTGRLQSEFLFEPVEDGYRARGQGLLTTLELRGSVLTFVKFGHRVSRPSQVQDFRTPEQGQARACEKTRAVHSEPRASDFSGQEGFRVTTICKGRQQMMAGGRGALK